MPNLEEFCQITATMTPRMLGKMPQGARIDFPFEGTATSSHWEGERPVKGVDYVTVRLDGHMDLEIRATIGEKRETVAYQGIRRLDRQEPDRSPASRIDHIPDRQRGPRLAQHGRWCWSRER